ncbi:hypothetical protein SLEP1_g10314 [Rubroshorea leprosula]|uniref:Uncharacterized protein n=1 Tax=Rubroshorea leprosula TaxID=152421 RepID=A0AAV5IJ12_9ROSI|nr:hypothetical protein SLEP1_g10314 [Rubroshorea leprosula]
MGSAVSWGETKVFMDPRLQGRFSIKGALKAIQLAVECKVVSHQGISTEREHLHAKWASYFSISP